MSDASRRAKTWRQTPQDEDVSSLKHRLRPVSDVSPGVLGVQILKYLHMEELHITHYGLGVRGVTALAAALKVNLFLSLLVSDFETSDV